MEAREDEAEMELRLPFRELPRENNAKQPAQTQKTGKKRAQARRSERASPESPPRQDVDSENVPPPAPKRVRQNKTAKVQKKLATRIIMAEAPPSDDGGGDLQPYADGLANDATLAIETVVANTSAEGNPIQVPDEWKNATPPFACSALCDAKMAKMEQRLEQLENTVAMLRAALEDGQNQPPEEPTNFAAAPPTPQSQSLSSVIGDAMAVVADVTTTPPAPVPWAESRDLAATVPNLANRHLRQWLKERLT